MANINTASGRVLTFLRHRSVMRGIDRQIVTKANGFPKEDPAPLLVQDLEVLAESVKDREKMDHGDLAKIEMLRFGVENEFFCFNVIGRLDSTHSRPVPFDSRNDENKPHGGMKPVLLVVNSAMMSDSSQIYKVLEESVTRWGAE